MEDIKQTEVVIDELVERFYDKLTKTSYFQSLFGERNVDIEQLKDKQRVFLSRLLMEDASKGMEQKSQQIQRGHSFHIDQEGATIWIQLMEESVHEMDVSEQMKTTLMNRLQLLLKQLTNR